jgi:hypothetical protein
VGSKLVHRSPGTPRPAGEPQIQAPAPINRLEPEFSRQACPLQSASRLHVAMQVPRWHTPDAQSADCWQLAPVIARFRPATSAGKQTRAPVPD